MRTILKFIVLDLLILPVFVLLYHTYIDTPKTNKIVFRSYGENEKYKGEVWMTPIIQPFMSFKVVKGRMPLKGETVLCDPKFTTRKVNEHEFNVVQLQCENDTTLELVGIDFGNN